VSMSLRVCLTIIGLSAHRITNNSRHSPNTDSVYTVHGESPSELQKALCSFYYQTMSSVQSEVLGQKLNTFFPALFPRITHLKARVEAFLPNSCFSYLSPCKLMNLILSLVTCVTPPIYTSIPSLM
jgi:hypothetical protein